VHIPPFGPEFPEDPDDVLVAPELRGVDAAFHAAEQGFLDPGAGKEIQHFVVHLAAYMGIAAEGVPAYHQAAYPGIAQAD
jgi:hypothetical protein